MSNSMPRVCIFTSDKQDWCLRPCEWFMRKYWPHADMLVVGFRQPLVPMNMPFYSLGSMADYPYQRWSNAAIDFLSSIPDEIIIFSMEDFWPVRMVDEEAVAWLANFMLDNPHVSRVDLTTDREYAADAKDVASLDRLDLIMNPIGTAYTLSLQVGLWRRTELLRYLVPDETPHQVELNGTQRMIASGAVVLGCRQNPVRALIAVQNGVLSVPPMKNYQVPMPLIANEDLEAIAAWLP